MRIEGLIYQNNAIYAINKRKHIAFTSDVQQNNCNDKPKKNKVKDFLIDFCIGWTIWDVASELWKYFSKRGKG